MASSLTSSLSSTTTVSSASLRRSSALQTHHRPNSISLPKPTRFRSVRAQSEPEKGRVEKAGEDIKDISLDTLKAEVDEINEKNVEKIGSDTEKAVEAAKAAKAEIDGVVEDIAETTAERVAGVWDAATGKS